MLVLCRMLRELSVFSPPAFKFVVTIMDHPVPIDRDGSWRFPFLPGRPSRHAFLLVGATGKIFAFLVGAKAQTVRCYP